MGRIQQLDTQTANMIAAGEVVERPMGVVKELVENAIDAGSTRITVSILEGGLTKLTVTDNGCGMDRGDAEMCFARHATSKIRKENDLWAIHTLGFRGEALPSIASVSKTTLTTSDGNDSTRVIISYGKVESVSPYPSEVGTEISVEGLFYHTPARLKHMRSNSYETSLIQDVIGRFALSHPEIAFQFIVDGRETFRTSGQGNLLEVIYSVFGRSAAENAKEVSFSDFDYQVDGYLVLPELSRASRNQMVIFLNGRMVRTYRLYQAIRDGYGDSIPKGRYPMCVLSIQMDPHLLDVNVHPSKWEVRLSKERQLEYLLQDEVRKQIQGDRPLPKANVEEVRMEYYQPMAMDLNSLMVKDEPVKDIQKEEHPIVDQSVEIKKESSEEVPLHFETQTIEVPVIPTVEKETVEEEEQTPLPEMRILGQLHATYIVSECEQGLVLIDQRSALRRIHYEEILQSTQKDTVLMDMLVPITIDVEPSILTKIEEINEAIKPLSLSFEPFGNNTVLVRSIPSWMKDLEEETFLKDLLDALTQEKNVSYEKVNAESIAKLASQNIRGVNKNYSNEELQAIVEQLKNTRNPWTAPDGKSVLLVLEEKEFAKEFKK